MNYESQFLELFIFLFLIRNICLNFTLSYRYQKSADCFACPEIFNDPKPAAFLNADPDPS